MWHWLRNGHWPKWSGWQFQRITQHGPTSRTGDQPMTVVRNVVAACQSMDDMYPTLGKEVR